MKRSGRVMGLNLRRPESSRPSSARNCMMWAAKPPMEPSSIEIMTPCSLAAWRTSCVSSGLQKRASMTVALTPSFSIISAAASASLALEPYASRHTSLPWRRTTPLPISSGVPFRSLVMPCALRSRPRPLPRGKRKHEGRSSIAAAVATMLMSSASLEGAMHTMLGSDAMKVTSNAPQCVAPSAPTRPARSMAKRTGRFWRDTSCTIWS
mmetsp:Transcript_12318/g.30134  ORF Transcript_12318/g.30134 Transcript_12318/m.30134 type:complete len:209 (-) Transcript_12318:1505-2131(-)